MTTTLRRLLLATGIACAALAAGPAPAQSTGDWPNRPVRMIMPYAAGGPTDVLARLLADRMSQRLPQRVVVENRTGAGGNIGASAAAKSAPDGHTLLFTNMAHAVNKALYANLYYDPERDLAQVSIIAESPMVLMVPPNSPWRSLQEMVAQIRAEPGRHSYGSAGGGGALQLVSLTLIRATGMRMIEVPYRGSAPAVPDLAAGRLSWLFDAGPTGFALAQSGQVRAIAVTADSRSPAAPDLPTVAEAGFPDARFSVWQVVLVPSATPAPLIARIQQEIAAVLAEPAVRSRLAEMGAERVLGNTPEEARAYVAAEMARWAPILREAGIRAQ